MPKDILVTGGAGFIGSRLVAALQRVEPSGRIWIFDNLHPQVHGTDAVQPTFTGDVEFVRGEIANKSAVEAVVASCRPEVVYHLAAETGTGQSYDEVCRYCEVNVTGTANLVEAIRSYSASATERIVLAASRAVYGEGGYKDANGRMFAGLPREAGAMQAGDFSVPMPADARPPMVATPSNTSLPPAPASIYASTKLMQEYIILQTGEGARWKSTILRFQNVYGPGQSLRNPYSGVLSIFASQLLQGKTLSIYEDGKIARDFVYVDDAASALVQAGRRDLPHGSTFDIGSGVAVDILEVAQRLMTYLECATDRFRISGEFRVGDIRYACADIRRSCEQLDWEPGVSIDKGLLSLAEWARSNYMSDTF